MKTCKDCQEREIGCHGSCERYSERVEKFRDYKRRHLQATDADKFRSDNIVKTINRIRKKG